MFAEAGESVIIVDKRRCARVTAFFNVLSMNLIPTPNPCARVLMRNRSRLPRAVQKSQKQGTREASPLPLPRPIIGHQSHQWMLWSLSFQQVWLSRSWTPKLLAPFFSFFFLRQEFGYENHWLTLDLVSPDRSQSPLLGSCHLLHHSQGLGHIALTDWTPNPLRCLKNLQNPPWVQPLQGITSSQTCFRLLWR